MFIVCYRMDGRWSVCIHTLDLNKRTMRTCAQTQDQIDKRMIKIKRVLLCNLVSISLNYVSSACALLSFSFFLPLSVPLQHVKVLDVVYINLSIFLQG